jgi:hypothetical protein
MDCWLFWWLFCQICDKEMATRSFITTTILRYITRKILNEIILTATPMCSNIKHNRHVVHVNRIEDVNRAPEVRMCLSYDSRCLVLVWSHTRISYTHNVSDKLFKRRGPATNKTAKEEEKVQLGESPNKNVKNSKRHKGISWSAS